MMDKIFDTPPLTKHECMEQGVDKFTVGRFEMDFFGERVWFVSKRNGCEFIKPLSYCPFCGKHLAASNKP
jgi:hypothetical protein